MGASVFKINAEGNGVMAESMTVPTGQTYRLVSVSLKFDTAPTTSENYTLTLNANAGGAYDVLLYSVDPAAHAMTDLIWMPDEELFLEGDDVVEAAYAGTDLRHWGLQYTVKAVA
jgi:hypothetical protein